MVCVITYAIVVAVWVKCGTSSDVADAASRRRRRRQHTKRPSVWALNFIRRPCTTTIDHQPSQSPSSWVSVIVARRMGVARERDVRRMQLMPGILATKALSGKQHTRHYARSNTKSSCLFPGPQLLQGSWHCASRPVGWIWRCCATSDSRYSCCGAKGGRRGH